MFSERLWNRIYVYVYGRIMPCIIIQTNFDEIEISYIVLFPYELGWKIKKEERKTFMQCKVCKGMQCSFKSCFDTLNDTPTCKSPEPLPVTSTTNDYMYMDTTNEDFCQVFSTNRTQEKKGKSTVLVDILRLT